MSCIEEKWGLKDIHCIAENASLFVSLFKNIFYYRLGESGRVLVTGGASANKTILQVSIYFYQTYINTQGKFLLVLLLLVPPLYTIKGFNKKPLQIYAHCFGSMLATIIGCILF